MKKRFLLFLLVCFSSLISILLIFFVIETVFRMEKRGIVEGLKSYFQVEVPKNEAGEEYQMIADDELGFRLNPNNPEINSLSMKNAELVMPKPEGIKRIVILGDSVPWIGDPSFVDILQNKLNNSNSIEIINASTPGYTTYQELIFLKKYILQIDPDVVILAYALNDNHKFLHKYDVYGNMLLTEEAENSLVINTGIDQFLTKSYFFNFLKMLIFSMQKNNQLQEFKYWWEGSVDFNTAWKDNSWTEFAKQIREMNDLLSRQQAQFFVVIFPLQDQLFYDEFSTPDFNYIIKPQKQVLYYCDKYNIPALDLLSYFQEYDEFELYTDGLHLSDSGHALSAELIEKLIFENF